MIEFSKIKKAYFIGIKGSGMISIVEFFHSYGIEISGSDTKEKFFTDEILKRMGIKYFENFSKNHIASDVDLIIYSTAYNEKNNEEFLEAKNKNLLMASYPQVLAELFNKKYGIAVCGTHGKTTTSAMLASVLKLAGKDPNAAIGSKVPDWQSNALVGSGELFVIEADEFQNKLKFYKPKGVILTSLDWDHPDFYKSFSDYKIAFFDFVSKLIQSNFLVYWGDSVDTVEVSKRAVCQKISYGFNNKNDFYAVKKSLGKFEVFSHGKSFGIFEIQLIGDHNILNSLSVIATCFKLGLEIEKIRDGLRNFKGTKRRFEYKGQKNGAILIDDYGHHPEEIKATLKAAKETYPDKNIIVVFHPHSFSRTEALLQEFAQSFNLADRVIVLDIYGSAREYVGKVSSKDLVSLISKYNFGKAEYIPKINDVVMELKDKINEKDLVLGIGAGNVFEVLEKLAK